MSVISNLKNALIVSCQSEGDDPFNSPELVARFAQAAVMGGAKGIRSQGYEKTKAIVQTVQVPVIGLIKSKFEDGYVKITGSFEDVEKLLETGCHIIAVDGTFRIREGMNGPQFISEIKRRYNCIVMADVSVYGEGLACADFGADIVSSTLSGYTPETYMYDKDKPDFDIIERLKKAVDIPIFAEGRINKPEFAKQMIHLGAWAVVVGTAITRPRVVTGWFKNAVDGKDEIY